jgi:hypothetical protein
VSTRSSIWYAEDGDKVVHIYWELRECELDDDGELIAAPVYISAGSRDSHRAVAMRLPKEIAMKLLMILSQNWTENVRRVL